MLPSVVHVTICMWQENLDPGTWFLLMKINIPFEISKRQVAKWISLLSTEMYITLVNGCVSTIVFSYFISCCFYVENMCTHFHSKFRLVNKKAVRVRARKTIRCYRKVTAKGNRRIVNESKIINGINAELANLISSHLKIIE